MCVALWPVFDRFAVTENRENLMEKASFRFASTEAERVCFSFYGANAKKRFFRELKLLDGVISSFSNC